MAGLKSPGGMALSACSGLQPVHPRNHGMSPGATCKVGKFVMEAGARGDHIATSPQKTPPCPWRRVAVSVGESVHAVEGAYCAQLNPCPGSSIRAQESPPFLCRWLSRNAGCPYPLPARLLVVWSTDRMNESAWRYLGATSKLSKTSKQFGRQFVE